MTAFLLSVPTLAILAGACLVAMLYRRCAREVPILMYHRIAQIPGDRNSVPPAMFAAQLAYLQRHGYRTITLGALHTARTTGAALPAKSVILTFDDAYDDNLTVALPMLQQYGMVGAVGVITGWVGTPNDWEAYPGKP
ncbi:MAG TPA: polysaccharide deacetylase family protein, partial [Armatimonadota bacterium]